MPYPALAQDAATTGGFLLVMSVCIPIASALLGFAAGGRWLVWIALATLPLGLAIAVVVLSTSGPLVYLLGGWAPPLGVTLRADGLSAVMLTITAVVICAIGVYASADFHVPAGSVEARAPFAFWILLLAIWSALNMVFVGGDLFTLYVALEMLTFAAVPLVCLGGRGETLQAALRYLLFALLYGAYGTLDIVLLSRRVQPEPATFVAATLMTVGLLAKTALFPLHLWLPPAHAGAPAAGSAILSALVVKGSFFIVVRLWFDVMPGVPGFTARQLLAASGAGAVLFASVVALRQERLKLLIAYSTLAQIGFLFLMFPLSFQPAHLDSGAGLSGGLLQAISHATAKAAMFMSAGLFYAALGHDRITGLAGIGRALPISVLAFAVAGVALIGLPPSGAYMAKKLLLQAAGETDQWWWEVVIQAGGIFTSAYVLLVIVHALAPADDPLTLRVRAPWHQQAAALSMALCSLLLGLVHWDAYFPVPRGTRSMSSILETLTSALWPVVAGAVLAILLGRWKDWPPSFPLGGLAAAVIKPIRRATLFLSDSIEQVDDTLRQWPAAGLSLLVLAILLAAAMLAGR